MVRIAPILLLLTGCVSSHLADSLTSAVPPQYFGKESAKPPFVDPSKLTPASMEVALHVDKIGRDIIAANPSIGLKPQFGAISNPNPEMFHLGTSSIFVTSGLMERCRGDADVAALLSLELARMVADREALAPPEVYETVQQPPSLQSLFEKQKPAPRPPIALRPDPNELSRKYLAKSGFKAEDMDAVAPLVRAANANYTLEKQFRNVSYTQWQRTGAPAAPRQ